MNHFLKRFELKAISRVAVAAINERKKDEKQEAYKYTPAIIPMEAGTVLKMLREIEHRRQQNYIEWCKRMAAQKKQEQK